MASKKKAAPQKARLDQKLPYFVHLIFGGRRAGVVFARLTRAEARVIEYNLIGDDPRGDIRNLRTEARFARTLEEDRSIRTIDDVLSWWRASDVPLYEANSAVDLGYLLGQWAALTPSIPVGIESLDRAGA